jgi:hypothetical protein
MKPSESSKRSQEDSYQSTDRITIPDKIWEMMERVFFILSRPASKKAKPGHMPNTRTVQIWEMRSIIGLKRRNMKIFN